MAANRDIYFLDNGATGGWTGSGSAQAPYQGGPGYVWIDEILAAPSTDQIKYIPPNSTLRFGPGVFLTKGNNGSSTTDWAVRNGWRLLGTGVDNATLKLSGVVAGELRAAIGMNFGGAAIDGLEVSNLTIDCGFPVSSIPANSANTAVAVFGKRILLRGLRVTNYGTNRSGVRVSVIQAGSAGTEDSVVEECVIEPGTSGAAPTGTPSSFVLILFGGQAANPNRGCVVRNCVLRGPAAVTSGTDNPVHGICPGAAVGFIAEHNYFFDLMSGVYDVDLQNVAPIVATETTVDVVIRNNYMHNVWAGVNYWRSWPVSRLYIHDNFIDVANRPLISGPPIGINLQWAVDNSNRYASVILRENIIRSAKWDTSTPGQISGINVNQVTDLNIENNVINDAATGSAIVLGSISNQWLSNNKTTAGQPVHSDTKP